MINESYRYELIDFNTIDKNWRVKVTCRIIIGFLTNHGYLTSHEILVYNQMIESDYDSLILVESILTHKLKDVDYEKIKS